MSYLSLISSENLSSDLDIGHNLRIMLIATLKANLLLSIKFLFRKTSLVMLKLSIIHAKLLDKNTKLRVLLTKSRKNGNLWILQLKITKKHGKSKELMPFLPLLKTTWEFFQPRKLVFFMKTSKIKSKLGRITFKKYQKPCKC